MSDVQAAVIELAPPEVASKGLAAAHDGTICTHVSHCLAVGPDLEDNWVFIGVSFHKH